MRFDLHQQKKIQNEEGVDELFNKNKSLKQAKSNEFNKS